MKSAYDTREIMNLHILKEVAHWRREEFITGDQLTAIRAAYPSKLYHPNLAIRILLFIASCIAVGGAGGLLFLMIESASDTGQGIFFLIVGTGAVFFAQRILIESNNHFRSGVVEAVAYSGCGYLIGGMGLLTNWNEHSLLVFSVAVLAFMSFWFLDLICQALAVLTFAGLIFFECYSLGGIFRQIIPFVLLVSFSAVYMAATKLRKRPDLSLWEDNLWLTQVISLLVVYAAGNYLVVRECSIALLNMSLVPGEDIPLAFAFYVFTAVFPVALFYRGTKTHNMNQVRLAVIMLALSVLTFRYYFSIAPPEVALTLAGIFVLGIAAWLFRYLKTPRSGFTQEKLFTGKGLGPHVTAFAISQTMGGNVTKADETFKGGGGSFGGGGASGDY